MSFLVHLAAVLGGLALVCVSLPLALELAALSLAARLPVRRALNRAAQDYRLAVVIPAHNEETLIGACVRSALASAAPALRVYVVAHNCTDRTAQAAEQAGALALPLSTPVGGKGVALDFGFQHALAAGAQGVLVLDADSVASPGLIPAITARLDAGARALQCRYLVANGAATTRTQLAAIAFLGMNVLRPRGRDRLGLSCGIFGNGFALAAQTLQRIPYVANSLVEDVEYHLHLIRAGLRVEFVDEASVLGEMPEGGAAAASQRARWEGGRLLMRRTWRGPLLREVLRGRVRMLEPLLDLLSLPLATQGAALLAAGALAFAARLPWLGIYAAAALLACVGYLGVAASLSDRPAASLRALIAAPGYVVWKIGIISRTRKASRTDAAWVRTARNSEAEPQEKSLP